MLIIRSSTHYLNNLIMLPKTLFKDSIFLFVQVYTGLQSQVGLVNQVADDISWTLLRCIHDDQKVHSAQWFALKAVCNTKLAVALTIMEECFVSMLDPRTGIHMIPQVLYNWGLVLLPFILCASLFIVLYLSK